MEKSANDVGSSKHDFYCWINRGKKRTFAPCLRSRPRVSLIGGRDTYERPCSCYLSRSYASCCPNRQYDSTMRAVLPALIISSLSHAIQAFDPGEWAMENWGWTFNIWLDRHDTFDCSGEKIGEQALIDQDECTTWDDDTPFPGFRYYVLPTQDI